MIQGLSAFLLCICFVYNTHPDTAFSRDSLQALIISRIGKDVLVGRLERFKECNAVKGSHLYFQVKLKKRVFYNFFGMDIAV